MKNYKIADEVWHRIVQIIQEAMLEGVDCADLLRMVRVAASDTTDELVLTEEYKQSVKEMHEKLLEQAKQIANKTATLIVD
jgi:hypothetical protein